MTYENIKPYLEKGLVTMQTHPECEELAIFNYSPSCQFSGAWDDVTRACRGLILNVVTGEIAARPFPKFFNYEEHIAKGWPVPDEVPIVNEKLDGSLGILYKLHGKPYIATRGSFTSEQAIWATNWWREHVAMLPEDGETNLFEIIYPANRIVVAYDFSGLVHLTTLSNATGRPIPRGWGIGVPKSYQFTSFDAMKTRNAPNEEGYVFYFPKADVRMKMKFAEYARLHKLVTGLSEIAIWEQMREGKKIELGSVPDEFYLWITKVQTDLKNDFDLRFAAAFVAAEEAKKLPSRKEQAAFITAEAGVLSGVAFSLLDDNVRRANEQIWRMIRPHGQSSFKVDIDA